MDTDMIEISPNWPWGELLLDVAWTVEISHIWEIYCSIFMLGKELVIYYRPNLDWFCCSALSFTWNWDSWSSCWQFHPYRKWRRKSFSHFCWFRLEWACKFKLEQQNEYKIWGECVLPVSAPATEPVCNIMSSTDHITQFVRETFNRIFKCSMSVQLVMMAARLAEIFMGFHWLAGRASYYYTLIISC